MNKKQIHLGLAAPLILLGISCTACAGKDPVNPDPGTKPTPTTMRTDGRIIEDVPYVDNSKKSYWCETYSNGTLPAGKDGNGTYTAEVADPSVVRGDDGMFYMFGTNRVALKSEDAVNWQLYNTNIVTVGNWASDWAKEKYGDGNGLGIWAPDVIKVQDQWIYYYSVSGWSRPVGIGYAVSDNPAGPFIDGGRLFIGEDVGIQNCIDPSIFIEDGKVYMTVGSFQGEYLVELTDDGMALEGGETYEEQIAYAKKNKVLIAGKPSGWDGAQYEGTYLTKKGDSYYLFASSGTCCAGTDSTYTVWVGKADDIKGPYVGSDGKPMTLSGNNNTYGNLVVYAGVGEGLNAYGTGHNSILIDDAGDWWIYYHAYIKADNFKTRHYLIDKLEWDEDDYPFVGENQDGKKKRPSYDYELDGPRWFEEE